ncbi:MAG: hypothetical protein IPP71_04095 [Bacteroidetes bacterium]|nr:hypothetical protein [Bacteroidota bacterium]
MSAFRVYQNFEEAQNVNDDYYVRGGGFVEKKLSRFENRKHPVEKWNLDAGQLKAFESVIRFLKQEKCNFVLVQAPVTRSLYHAKTNNSEIDTFFSTYGRYFNFNEVALPLDDSLHFYDSDHLNQEGVVIFNTAFIKAMNF